MKSIVIEGPGRIRLIEAPEPAIAADEVLLEIRYIGLCGSDLNSFRGSSPLVIYPVVPGHEVSGVIVNKGSGVPDHVMIGDHVTVNPYTACGQCAACRAGRVNTCAFNQTLGVQRNGALGEYFSINYRKILKSTILDEQAFALVEPLSVGYHAANRGAVSEIDTVLVIGCGVIGIGAIIASVKKGATVIAADLDENKLKLVRSFGVRHVINPKKTDLFSRVMEITRNEGADVCIEAVGSPSTYTAAVDAAAFGGRVVYIGYAKNEVSFNTSLFVRKELTIYGSRNALKEFGPVIQLFEEGVVAPNELVSAIYPIEETALAFEDWNSRPQDFIKILIDVKKDRLPGNQSSLM